MKTIKKIGSYIVISVGFVALLGVVATLGWVRGRSDSEVEDETL